MRHALIAAVALICISGPALSATDNEGIQDLVRLDSEIQRASQALATDAASSRPAVEALLKRVDLINSAYDARQDESSLARAKREALRGMLYNLRLALEQPTMASRIAMRSAQARGPLVSSEGVAGVGCEQALELVAGQPMRIEIPTGESRWIAVRSPLDATAPLAVTTVGSDIDAAANVYADCRDTSKKPISSGDDNYGLQAIALLPPAAQPLLVQLRNQSERGIATINAIQAVTINGRITRSDTGAPIPNMRVESYQGASSTNVQSSGSANSQSDGTYQLTTYTSTVGTNTYVRTSSYSYSRLYIDKAWDNIVCSTDYGLSGCGPGVPTPAAMADGVVVSDVNFAVSPGGTISGQVQDRSGNPIGGALVFVNQAGAPPSAARNAQSDTSGRYRVGALPDGQYRLVSNTSGYKIQVFKDFDCDTNCDQIAGTPVPVVEFGEAQANFSLSRGSNIRVTMTSGGQPIISYFYVYAYNAAGTYAGSASLGSGGVGVLGPLPAGTYRVRAEGDGFVSEYYQDVVCATTCGPAEFQAATPITITNDAPPVQIAMDIARVPEITGVVTDTSGAPIENAYISISMGGSRANTYTGSDGSYRVRPPKTGAYLIHARSLAHIDEAYDNTPCNDPSYVGSCPGATPLIVSAGIVPPPANFQLAPSATIRGRVSRPAPYYYFQVSALTSTHEVVEAGVLSQQADGTYQLADLPAGQFRFGYSPQGSDGRLQLFQNIDCGMQASTFAQCPMTGATSVTLSSGSVTEGIDFSYRSRTGRLGRVTDETTGLPLAGIIIDAYLIGGGQILPPVITDANGRFDVSSFGGTGQYAIATDNYLGYLNEVYNNIECAVGSVYLGTCSLTGATPISFQVEQTELLIALRRQEMVFRSGFD